jgi:hypothetical protein
VYCADFWDVCPKLVDFFLFAFSEFSTMLELRSKMFVRKVLITTIDGEDKRF